MIHYFISGMTLLVFMTSCARANQFDEDSSETTKESIVEMDRNNLKTAYFASGCFWCVEAIFESVKGVHEAISGYSGGSEKNPTYNEVSLGRTGHAEAVQVFYDPDVVSYQTLVNVFFNSHDPTTLNRQGPDAGKQYRSAIFYETEKEKSIIEKTIQGLLDNGVFSKITTEVSQFTVFYAAEEYHQDFERRNPNQGYVRAVSIPRLTNFKKKMPEVLKESARMH